MMGYTGVGKSKLANKLAKILNADIFHSAVIRKELGLTPKTKEEADKFFDYRNKLREEVDRKVYGKMLDYAMLSLKKGKNVILDAGHFFNWQRENIYKKIASFNVEIFILRVVCKDEKEIRRRLEERSSEFGSSALAETPSWNTYIATKIITEDPEKDILPEKMRFNIIEYDNLTGNTKIVKENKNAENTKKILNTIEANSKKSLKKANIKDNFVIALDFDGVVTSPYKLKTKYINQFGYNITEGQCGYDYCIRKLGIKKLHYEKALFKAFTEKPDKLPLEKGFMKNFLKIKKLDNVKIFLVTSRHSNMLEHLRGYLEYHKIKMDGIINTGNKNKGYFLNKIKANIFIEDSPFRLNQIFSKNKNLLKKCIFILFRNSANKIEKLSNKSVIEASNWGDLYKIIIKEYKDYMER